jgi:hypothetical protein
MAKLVRCRTGASSPSQPSDGDGGWVTTRDDITDRLRAERRIAHGAA